MGKKSHFTSLNDEVEVPAACKKKKKKDKQRTETVAEEQETFAETPQKKRKRKYLEGTENESQTFNSPDLKPEENICNEEVATLESPVKKMKKKRKYGEVDKSDTLTADNSRHKKEVLNDDSSMCETPVKKSKKKRKQSEGNRSEMDTVNHSTSYMAKEQAAAGEISFRNTERSRSKKHEKIRNKKSKSEASKTNDTQKVTFQSAQDMLVNKLKSVQSKRSQTATNNITSDKQVVQNENETTDKHSTEVIVDKQNVKDNSKRQKKEQKVAVAVSKENSADNDDEEEDPEKAAIRKKKREKRRQKKVEKEKKKQEEKERAGTAKTSALEYLETWKNNREEWKFLKVWQCWLLQNLYDSAMVDDKNFEVLLEYLNGLKGKSRELTVAGAEKILEEDENDEQSSESGGDSVKLERARQIIQLLSM